MREHHTSHLTVDVIIPAHNAALTLGAAVGSALCQNHPPARVLVVADRCSDDSAELARRAGAEVFAGAFGSAGAARNHALTQASASHVAFLDADDLWRPTWLGAALQECSAHAGGAPSLVFSTPDYLDERGTLRRAPAHPPPGADVRDVLLTGPLITTSATLVHRQSVLDAGAFDPDFREAEDWDLWLRLSERGVRFTHLGGAHVLYRVTRGSAMRSAEHLDRLQAQHVQLLERALARRPVTPAVEQRAWQYVWQASAMRRLEAGQGHAVRADLARLWRSGASRTACALLASASLLPAGPRRSAMDTYRSLRHRAWR